MRMEPETPNTIETETSSGAELSGKEASKRADSLPSPRQIFMVSVGVLLIGAALVVHVWGIEFLFVLLIFALGAAILLGAFGGDATIKMPGIPGYLTGSQVMMTGVAAVAAIIVYFVNSEHKERLQLQKKSYMTGKIDGLPLDRFDVKLKLDDFVPSKHQADLKRFDFVVFKSELDRSGPASLDIEYKRDSDGQRSCPDVCSSDGQTDDSEDQIEVLNFAISKDCLAGFLGQEEPVIWKFDEVKKAIVESQTGTIIAKQAVDREDAGNCLKQPLIGGNATGVDTSDATQGEEGPGLWSLISTAFAGEQQVTRQQLDMALKEIQSSDSDVRRSARVILASAEPEDVSYMLSYVREKLAKKERIYRTKLGVSLALAEMLRRDKSLRDRMKLGQADIAMLLDFAGSEDRNLRIYSGEFLFDLESPEVARHAIPRALKATNDDARYNWILVSKGGWLRMTEQQKEDLRPVILKLKASTAQLPETAKLLEFFS